MQLSTIEAQILTLPTRYQRNAARVALARLRCAQRARDAGDLQLARAELDYARSRLCDVR